MPPRGPEETSGSMPMYSEPAPTDAASIAATRSFSLAPAATAAIPAASPASVQTAAFSIISISRADLTMRRLSTIPPASPTAPIAP